MDDNPYVLSSPTPKQIGLNPEIEGNSIGTSNAILYRESPPFPSPAVATATAWRRRRTPVHHNSVVCEANPTPRLPANYLEEKSWQCEVHGEPEESEDGGQADTERAFGYVTD